MKKKIIGILVCMLMITITVLPVAMSINMTMNKNNNDVIRTSDYVLNEEILDEIENTMNKKLIVNEIIGDRQVKYWEHIIDNFEIKNDCILLHYNTKDDEILKYEKNWRDINVELPDSENIEFEPDRYFWKQLVVFLTEDDLINFYSFQNIVDYPIVCWEVRHTDGTTILYDFDGNKMGCGVPAPSKGFSLSGFNNATWPDPWIEYRENANHWFSTWCDSTISISLPDISTISSHISDSTTECFYEQAHGDEYSFQADAPGSMYFASTLHNDMENRQPMKFAFIGSCHGMTSTGSGTFSYEFRKGQMTNTVTVGYDHMEECQGWEYAWYWQSSMFENMSRGLTIKESFDMATAQYPTIEPAVVFLGDEKLIIALNSDLTCEGALSWTDIKPGTEITGSFTISNIGDSASELDWKVESAPDLDNDGDTDEWTFSPNSGDNLKPGDGPVTVQVSVVAPGEEEQTFSGEVKVINEENSSDYCTISVSLATPKNKSVNLVEVSIIQPWENTLYIFGTPLPILPHGTIIFGNFTVLVSAISLQFMDKLEFYVDDVLKHTETDRLSWLLVPWDWDETIFFKHTLKVIAYDKGENVASDEMDVWIFNI